MRLDDVDGGGRGHAVPSLCKMPSGRACQRPIRLKPCFCWENSQLQPETGRSGGGPKAGRECRHNALAGHGNVRNQAIGGFSRGSFQRSGARAEPQVPLRGVHKCFHNGNVATFMSPCRWDLPAVTHPSEREIADILVDFTNPLDIYVAGVSAPHMPANVLNQRVCAHGRGSSGVGGCGIAIRPAADRHAAAFRPPSRRSAGANGVSIVRSASELTPSIRQGQYRRAGRGPVARRARVGERIARSVGDEVRDDRPHRLLADRDRAREGPLQEVRHRVHREQGRELGRHPRLALDRRSAGDAHADRHADRLDDGPPRFAEEADGHPLDAEPQRPGDHAEGRVQGQGRRPIRRR